MYTVGFLKEKNWLTPGMRTAQMSPTTQARKVDAGIVGSSVLETADRTSAYGDSSCIIESVGSKLGSSMSMACMFPVISATLNRGENGRINITIIGGVAVLWDALLNVGVLPPVFRYGHG
jgi:hypothetical protein